MGAEDGISLGVKLVITIAVCTILLVILSVGRHMIQGQLNNINKINSDARNMGYSQFDNKIVYGYDLVDKMKELSNNRVGNQYFQIQIHTGTAHFTWTSEQSLSSIISDNPEDDAVNGISDAAPPYYVCEDWKFKCNLIQEDGSSGNVYGIIANLVLDDGTVASIDDIGTKHSKPVSDVIESANSIQESAENKSVNVETQITRPLINGFVVPKDANSDK